MNQLLQNVKAHNRIAAKYEKRHPEIFNPIEQARLLNHLKIAKSFISTYAERPSALDFGCGSGNVTKFLVRLGYKVTAADLSLKFLQMIKRKLGEQVITLLLNGHDLRELNNNSFDFVATYSVLHHVPDYPAILEEFSRIIKPGGVLFIGHEVSEDFWLNNNDYNDFLKQATPKQWWTKPFNYKSYKYRFMQIFNPRYQEEGDIHVFQDDHLEWGKITDFLDKNGFEIILNEDYLNYNADYKPDIYDKYKTRVNDMKALIVRKRN